MLKRLMLSFAVLLGVLCLSGAPNPAFADVSSQSAIAQNLDENEQLTGSFVSKYDNAIELDNNKFVLDESLLPENTTQDEIIKLKAIIKESNSFLNQQFKKVSKENIVKTDNSVVFAESAAVAQQEAGGVQNQSRIKFKEGSNYSHTYWWGKRVGVSRSKIRQVSGVITSSAGVVAGVLYFIPHAYAKAAAGAIGAAAGALGYPMSKFPGGIVFNTTPNYSGSQILAVAFQ
ncbi:hypothetical protein GHK52_03490 [Lactococcus garvieae]|nr:hypothetical protein [Lactococcus garvieae]